MSWKHLLKLIALILVPAAVAWILLGGYFLFTDVLMPAVQYQKEKPSIRQAEELLLKDDLHGVWTALKDVESPRGKEAARPIFSLRSAIIKYDNGDLEGAMRLLNGIHDLPKSLQPKAEELRNTIQPVLDEKARAEREEYLASLPNRFPHKGMLVEDIGKTCLGEPKLFSKTNYSEYYHYYNEKGQAICEVWVWKGVVQGVYDLRPTPAPAPYHRRKSSAQEDDFDVSDFPEPEDFYDWYQDDFDDYEEAEEYYYEHGGE